MPEQMTNIGDRVGGVQALSLLAIGALARLHVVAIWSPFRNKPAFLRASHERYIA